MNQSVNQIISKGREYRQSKNKQHDYVVLRSGLQALGLTPTEYEQAVRRLADAMGL